MKTLSFLIGLILISASGLVVVFSIAETQGAKYKKQHLTETEVD